MRSSLQAGHFSELGPVLAFIDLRPAGEDALDDLDFLGLDDVALFVSLHHLLEGLAD